MRIWFAVLVALALLPASAAASKPKPKPDLVVQSATAASAANRHAQVDIKVANKGKRKAKASETGVYLSHDAARDSADTALGSIDVPRLKPGKSASRSRTFAIPGSVANGTYRVIACADEGGVVKEKKEGNQCKPAQGMIVLTPPPPVKVSVSATAGSGGTVAASAVSGGTCTNTSCSLNSGAGSVTFTPTPSGINTFAGWTGAACTGYVSGSGDAITFANPTATKACTATFNEFVTISWENYLSWGSVSGCGGVFSSASSGMCVVPKGTTTGIVATPVNSTFEFDHWAGVTCDGTPSTAGAGVNRTDTMTFSNAVTDHHCMVVYKFAGT